MNFTKKHFLFALIAICFAFYAVNPVFAQETEKPEGYIFTNTKEVKHTPVKNQNRSGTCWSFSGIGFLESELLRKGKGEMDLSDMWIVYHTYKDKADMYVRMHGNSSFSAGGAFFDVFAMIDKYGIVPASAFNGLENTAPYPRSVADTHGRFVCRRYRGMCFHADHTDLHHH